MFRIASSPLHFCRHLPKKKLPSRRFSTGSNQDPFFIRKQPRLEARREMLSLSKEPNEPGPLPPNAITWVKLPLGVVSNPPLSQLYPLVHEESSVNIGATIMFEKYIQENIHIEQTDKGTKATVSIPFDRLKKGAISGKEMAKKIVTFQKFATHNPERSITNNKGIINAILPFLESICPMHAIRETFQLLDLALLSGLDYDTKVSQYGPIVQWQIKHNTLNGTVFLPNLLFQNFTEEHTSINSDAKPIFRQTQFIRPDSIRQSIAYLAIAQNLAALRSIVYLGNTKHHLPYHNAAVQAPIIDIKKPLIDQTPLDVLNSVVECFVGPAYYPLYQFYIGHKPVAALGPIQISPTVLSILKNASFNIKTKTPCITAQIVFEQIETNKLSQNHYIEFLTSANYQKSQDQDIIDYDQNSGSGALNRLEKRLGHSIRIPDKTEAKAIGPAMICLNIGINVGETQGANRANIYAELLRDRENQSQSITGWKAVGGILSNWHTDRGPEFSVRIKKSQIEDVGIQASSLIQLSNMALATPELAQEINISALEGMIAVDKATGQDTRANVAAFHYASSHPTRQQSGELLISAQGQKIMPFLVIEDDGDSILLKSGFPMASARTAVGRIVDSLDGVRIARDLMNIPISGDATGKVNQLDERACLLALTKALDTYISLAASTSNAPERLFLTTVEWQRTQIILECPPFQA